MEGFAPGLRENVLALTGTLRVVVYFVCVAGLMAQVNAARADMESLVRPIVRAIVVVALVATLPYWFESAEGMLLATANAIEEGYTGHPMRAATLLRESVQENPDNGFSLRRVGESVYRAFLWAGAKLLVLIGSVLQLPFLLLQYILKLLCYLFLPIALAVFMVPSLVSIGTRYLQQTLAILAWPIGFAVTEFVAYHLVTGYHTNVAIAAGVANGVLDPSSLASLLGGLLGALWLVLGTVATPFLMQMLFCSGTPLSGGGQTALQQLYAMQQVIWTLRSLGAAGAAIPAMAARTGSGPHNAGPMPPPPAAAASIPPAAPPPADPSGDRQAAAFIALGRVPQARTTI